ncbi:MAG TPA: hypothetical protein VMP01_29195 [Pirellulaceae bacterium]|nr:hypothetical protein [Pirellulaceae bacterium]
MRFTIRDLLWLTLLAAVLAAWWVDRGRLAADLRQSKHDAHELKFRLSRIMDPAS